MKNFKNLSIVVISFVLVIFIVYQTIIGSVLSSPANLDKVIGDGNIYKRIIIELKKFPSNFEPGDNNLENVIFVVHGELRSDSKLIDDFYKSYHASEKTSLIVTEYTDEGDPILTGLIYDGNYFYGVTDGTRDNYGKSTYHEFQYKYLQKFEEDNMIFYLLLNREGYTLEEIRNSYMQEDEDERIKHSYLMGYDLVDEMKEDNNNPLLKDD